MLSSAMSAIQPRMMGTANLRMNRGIAGRASCLATGMASVRASVS